MTILGNIVGASSILLALISTPAVVEGTNKCIKVCPNWVKRVPLPDGPWSRDIGPPPKFDESCWDREKHCKAERHEYCNAYCVCNIFGYNCEGCELVPGACGWTQRMIENEDICADFHSFTSLSADGKRDSLAEKYCGGDDQVVREDIYELLRDFTVLQFDEGDVLTCDLFNKAYGDVSHLTLCENKPQPHLDGGVPVSNKKGKKQKKTP